MERERSDAEYQSLCQEKQREINNFLNMYVTSSGFPFHSGWRVPTCHLSYPSSFRGNHSGAIKAAVADPPLGCKDQGIKVMYPLPITWCITWQRGTYHIPFTLGVQSSNDTFVLQDNYSRVVVSVLTAVKEADINKNIDSLNPDELDVLMKFIYKGLEDGENSTSLLKWHAAATAKGGLGSIVRALAERRTV